MFVVGCVAGSLSETNYQMHLTKEMKAMKQRRLLKSMLIKSD
jgi:hypothetical protein